MIQFKYAAKDNGGQTVQGVIQAATKAEAVAACFFVAMLLCVPSPDRTTVRVMRR